MSEPVEFRPLARDDLPLLATWLQTPHVTEWWPDPSDLESLEREYGPSIDGTDPTECFVIEWDGRPIGMIQRYRLNAYPEYRVHLPIPDGASIDYLIGDPTMIGQGIGPRVISAFAAATFERYPDTEQMVVGLQQANRRSWRALEKAGFSRVWAGMIESGDPSDAGPSYVYVLTRADLGAAGDHRGR